MNKYGFIRVGAFAPELRVADIDFNVSKIIAQIEQADRDKVKIVAFPENAICGASCGDLFFQDALRKGCVRGLDRIVKASADADAVIIVGLPLEEAGKLYSVAAVINKGKILGVVPKTHTSAADCKWFAGGGRGRGEISLLGQSVPFGADLLFGCGQTLFGVEIGGDLDALSSPSNGALAAGANLMFNISSENAGADIRERRRALVRAQSIKGCCGYVCAGAGAGESSTDWVFSGHLIIAEGGAILKEDYLPSFDSKSIVCDMDIEAMRAQKLRAHKYFDPAFAPRKIEFVLSEYDDTIIRAYDKSPFIPREETDKICEEILTLQAYALAKRLKHINSRAVVLGISGGLDSSLTLLVCVRAFDILGADKKGIHAFTLPGLGTSKRTYNTTKELAEAMGVTLKEVDISRAVYSHFEDIGHDPKNKNVTYENAQARERTQILMDYANSVGAMVMGTGCLSELALGWCTYGGDHLSMYQVNGSIPKTLERVLVAYEAKIGDGKKREVLNKVLSSPISPELLPADEHGEITQKTESLLGDYALHDFFLFHLLSSGTRPAKLLELARLAFEGDYDYKTIKQTLKVFITRLISSQYKRNSGADGPNIGLLNLSGKGCFGIPSDAEAAVWLRDLEETE